MIILVNTTFYPGEIMDSVSHGDEKTDISQVYECFGEKHCLIFSFQIFTIVYSKLCIFISTLVELMMQLLTCSHDNYTEVIFFLHVLRLNKLL